MLIFEESIGHAVITQIVLVLKMLLYSKLCSSWTKGRRKKLTYLKTEALSIMNMYSWLLMWCAGWMLAILGLYLQCVFFFLQEELSRCQWMFCTWFMSIVWITSRKISNLMPFSVGL